MGGRGSAFKERMRYQKTAQGYVKHGSLSDNKKRGNDDFTRRGIGDQLNVVGQHQRGRDEDEEKKRRKRR